MDATDLVILARLAKDGRASWAELGAAVGLTGPAVAERVRKLEQAGVIAGYAARIAPEAVGADLTAFVAVTVERPEHCAGFLAAIREMPEVLECHHVAGEDSYWLKVRTAGTRGLERLISDGLKRLEGVARTRTTIVLSTAKETDVPPLPGGDRS
ncbi:MAG TPA: Lrp/AsnC family transcriptional regulator [Symbiobacteriaceae bacterium]|jgi:Lrp/AsnC family leucine-responsive transcriptional regulator